MGTVINVTLHCRHNLIDYKQTPAMIGHLIGFLNFWVSHPLPSVNNLNDDGRSSLCQVEIPEECGDRIVDSGEQCDDGNIVSGDGCDASCMFEYCGDGIDQSLLGEQCDDGNGASRDGCSASCQVEPGFVCTQPGSPCSPIPALEERDLATSSDGLITFDAETGLEWLDPTVTTGLSYSDVQAGTGNTWLADGWRYATKQEVCGVTAKLGFAPSPCPGSRQARWADQGTTENHISLLGETDADSEMWTKALFDDENPLDPNVGRLEVSYASSIPPRSNASIQVDDPDGDPDTGSSTVGHMLVRVPEPRIVLSLMVGCVMLALIARRRAGNVSSVW